jgi:DNA repair exonuclease SbcCD ATPase subunit
MESVAIERELHELEEQEVTLSGQLSTGAARIDLAQARKRLEQQERVYETKKRGSLLVQAVQDRLLQKMLPRTEYYMQQLLPPLTHGRFHDARLTPVTYLPDAVWQLSVWEPQAFAYIPKSALSGGTADQLSLALRLAFAIAALPRELNAAPGFLLLDEPLGASDSERARALVELVTGPVLSSHFEQIVLVSHSRALNPALFAYRVFIDAGQVVESNLPVPASFAEVPDTHGMTIATQNGAFGDVVSVTS